MPKRPSLTEEEKKLLEIRKELKAKTPRFRRQESWRYKRVRESWRRPKGIDSKMRIEKKGWPKKVKVGYRGPRRVRGLHPSGYREILVHNVEELEGLNAENEAARIASGVGRKKRLEIIQRAEDLGIRVLNRRARIGKH